MSTIKDLPIHIFYEEKEYPYGYTIAKNNKEACNVAVELSNRTGSPVSVVGGMKYWKTGKYAYYIVKIKKPWNHNQLQGGYVVHTSIQ